MLAQTHYAFLHQHILYTACAHVVCATSSAYQLLLLPHMQKC
jgi:hypothetical protein